MSTRAKLQQPNIGAQWQCKHCRKVFVREVAYMEHECRQMKREAELKTPLGQAAWMFYERWMRAKNRMPPPASSFLSSKYFRTFVNFAKFAKDVNLPKPDRFITFITRKDLPPTIWTNDEVYGLYLEYIDRQLDPVEQAKLSAETLMKWSDNNNVPIDQVFEHIKPYEVIRMIQTRNLSPWLLLSSREFKKLFQTKLTPEQKVVLENLIRPEYYVKKRTEFPDVQPKILRLVESLGI